MTLTVTHAFVSGVADDPTAAAAGEVLPSHWNANHVVSGVRTMLTGNTNYYVTATGSDSHDGSLAHPWATLDHASSFIGNNIDFAGFTIYVHIGAGSFVGFGTRATVGGGDWQWIGAGSASTTITQGPNDGFFNFGDCIDVAYNNSFFGINGVTIAVPASNSGITLYAVGSQMYLGDGSSVTLGGATDLVFDMTNGNTSSRAINNFAAGSLMSEAVTMAGGGITFKGGGATVLAILDIEGDAVYENNVQWTHTGALTVNLCTAFVSTGSQIIIGLGSFGPPSAPILSGGATVTGKRFSVSDTSNIVGTIVLGLNWFPGTITGTCDQTSNYDHAIGTNLDYPIVTTIVRTVLTSTTNFYISTTGSDSHDGSSSNPWATLTHAMSFIGSTFDFGSQNVYINIGAGSFAGAGVRSFSGGGNLIVLGAGSGSTTITAGPNDGVFNFGECLDIDVFTSALLYVNAVKLKPGAAAVANYIIGTFLGMGDITNANGTDIIIDCSSATGSTIVVWAFAGGLIADLQNNVGISVTGGSATVQDFFRSEIFGLLEFGVPYTLSGTLTVSEAFATTTGGAGLLTAKSDGFSVSGGTVNGARFSVTSGGIIGDRTQGTGALGPTAFPGTSAGTCDSASNYDGFPGPLPGIDTQTGASYTLAIGDAFEIIEMNNAGANTVTIPSSSSVNFEIGTKIWVTQTGAGATATSSTTASGVILHNFGAIGGQWKSVKLYKRGPDEWIQTNT